MPSPFPGMDPFLEDPLVFPDFHSGFVTYLSESLQPTLPEPHYAALSRREWLEISERFVESETNVVAPRAVGLGKNPSTAVLEASQPVVVHVPHDKQSETFVEIYIGRGQDRRLVTAIELLSPANK